ncbi:hypothetical protein DL95DRAFT_494432 [Leptodontidium sp. 2 PMI_412]|nr:hypothetical protein DL95DRAFT_494432 [Leptodontidium sp. 2 PMI_412]
MPEKLPRSPVLRKSGFFWQQRDFKVEIGRQLVNDRVNLVQIRWYLCIIDVLSELCREVEGVDKVAVKGSLASVDHKVMAVDSHRLVVVGDREGQDLPVELLFALFEVEKLDDRSDYKDYIVSILPVRNIKCYSTAFYFIRQEWEAHIVRGHKEGLVASDKVANERCLAPYIANVSVEGTINSEISRITLVSFQFRIFRQVDSKRSLQEDLLSVHTLYFSADQLLWQCQTTKISESDPDPPNSQGRHEDGLEGYLKRSFLLPDNHPAAGLEAMPPAPDFLNTTLSGQAMDHWYLAVNEYAKRSLTVEQDRFPAISGIARQIERRAAYKYKLECGWKIYIKSLIEDIQPGTMESDVASDIESGTLRIQGNFQSATDWLSRHSLPLLYKKGQGFDISDLKNARAHTYPFADSPRIICELD